MLKKVIIGLQVVILAIVGYLLYKTSGSQEPEKYTFDDKGKQVSKLTENDIIVYYDQDSLIEKSNYIDSLQKAFKNSQLYWSNAIKQKETYLDDWSNEMNTKIDKGQLTMKEQEQAVYTDQELKKELIKLQETAEEKLAALQMEVLKNMNDAIYKTVKELNTKKKIKFVLAYGGKTQLVTPTDGALNVTSDMVEIINNLYKTKRK